MANRLRLPTLALAALSIGLNIAVIGCAGRTINFYNVEQSSNAWLLPIWPNHFDTRELQSLIGTSAVIIVLNVVLALALFISALPANIIVLSSSVLSTICSLISLIFPSVLNRHAPTTDTLQTWTCRWSNTAVTQGQGPPSQFGSICQETRFAFYTQIPLFMIQLCLVCVAVYAMFGRSSDSSTRRLNSDVEKGQHELGEVRNASFDTKSESPRSVQDSTRILGGSGTGAKTVGFA